jgi:NADH-quinone oxidoreductase subunit J
MNVFFLITAATAIASSILALTRRNAVHALLFLVVFFFSVALIFYISGAPFVAVMEIIIYAGAIVTLFVFVVMMLNLQPSGREKTGRRLKPSSWLLPVIMILVLQIEFMFILLQPSAAPDGMAFIGPRQVGLTLITEYILAVELTGMLLMAGIIGAYHLGKRKKKVVHRYLEKKHVP